MVVFKVIWHTISCLLINKANLFKIPSNGPASINYANRLCIVSRCRCRIAHVIYLVCGKWRFCRPKMVEDSLSPYPGRGMGGIYRVFRRYLSANAVGKLVANSKAIAIGHGADKHLTLITETWLLNNQNCSGP